VEDLEDYTIGACVDALWKTHQRIQGDKAGHRIALVRAESILADATLDPGRTEEVGKQVAEMEEMVEPCWETVRELETRIQAKGKGKGIRVEREEVRGLLVRAAEELEGVRRKA